MSESENYPVYGPQVKRPLRVRVLKIASLVLAFAGLVLLYFYSVNRGIPLVKVGDVTPTMNFAYVRVAGDVSRDAYIFKSGGFVFNLYDGTGEVAIMGSRTQAELLKNENRLPKRGDQVEVAGSLSIGADDEVKLRMQSADQLVLTRKPRKSAAPAAVSRIKLADITPAQDGDRMTVVGKLKEVSIPAPGSKAPYKLTLEEEGKELPVIFWDEVFQGLEQKLPTPGTLIRVSGRIELFKGAPQLKVWEAADLIEVKERAVLDLSVEQPVTAIADITEDQKGTVFTISGTLGEPKSIPGGVIYPITDESGEMVVLFWDKKVSGEERDALESGVKLRVTAPLVVYKGTLELIPEDVGAFRIEGEN